MTAHSIATSTAIAVGRATTARSIVAVSPTVMTDRSATMTGTSSVQRWRAASVNPTIVTIAITRCNHSPGPPATTGIVAATTAAPTVAVNHRRPSSAVCVGTT